MSADKLETEVLEEGDGAEVKEGDKVVTHIWIGNGFTEKQAFSTYDQTAARGRHGRREPQPGLRRGAWRARPSAPGSP